MVGHHSKAQHPKVQLFEHEQLTSHGFGYFLFVQLVRLYGRAIKQGIKVGKKPLICLAMSSLSSGGSGRSTGRFLSRHALPQQLPRQPPRHRARQTKRQQQGVAGR
ncbi:hypothetical protein [Hymenobacter roseosalivarius]|uniref:hypothetical protein n=1 Tax=Hymenobacter roseosalivarius TaxID=89967 RepID=UPI00135658A1|nr:hypothetical protein [Hymenobacter roseosalivarius]